MPTCPSDRKLSNLVCPGDLHGTAVGACQSVHVSVLKSNLLDWPARWYFFQVALLLKCTQGREYNIMSIVKVHMK